MIGIEIEIEAEGDVGVTMKMAFSDTQDISISWASGEGMGGINALPRSSQGFSLCIQNDPSQSRHRKEFQLSLEGIWDFFGRDFHALGWIPNAFRMYF